MKTKHLLMMSVPLAAYAYGEILDLTDLHSYANQEVPSYITKDNTPAGNEISDLEATLGRVMFYDKRLSVNGTISCASCHQQENAFSDLDQASTGVAGTTGRHSMRLINSRFADSPRFFWDERAATLEVQTTQPIQDHVEMGFSGEDGEPAFSDLVARMEAVEHYRVLFRGVHGSSEITEEKVQGALSQFVRSIQSFDSKYDEGRRQVAGDQVDFPNFTVQENQGKRLFQARPGPGGGAGCVVCHRAPEFDIDPNSAHNGVIASLAGGIDLTNTRSPSLRDSVKADGGSNGGFMHNGQFATLLQVVNHYNAIPTENLQGIDRRLTGGPGGIGQRLNLTEAEKNALVAFMRTLSGSSVYQDERWSDPFDDDNNLSLIVLPQSKQTLLITEDETGTAMVTVSSPAVPNVSYLFRQSLDLSEWSEGVPVVADAAGTVSITVPLTENAGYYSFAYQP